MLKLEVHCFSEKEKKKKKSTLVHKYDMNL